MNKKTLAAAALCTAIASPAFAGMNVGSFDLDPFLGVEYKYLHAKPKGDFDKIVPSHNRGGRVFLGSKFHEYFGLEVGYTHLAKDTKRFNTTTNSTLFNNAAGATGSFKNKIGYNSIDLHLNGYYGLAKEFNLLGTVGFNFTKAKITSTPQAVYNQFSGTGSRKANWVVGGGFEYISPFNLAFRIKAFWENTSKNIYKDNSASSPEKFLDNGYSVVAGLHYYFC